MDASSSALIEGLRAAAKVKDLSGQFDPSPRYLVASGGYSTVYIATWRSPECEGPMKVCYKELRPPVSNMREAVERTRKTVKYLTREMGVWSKLDHPNILKFLGFAVEGDGCDVKGVLVSPWCRNGGILEYLEKNLHAERIELAKGIAKGLDYLHHLTPAVIHGDLKPANVLVSDDHNAILCDFGLSRFSSELTTGQTSSAAAFTIRFTPPEVIFDEERKSTESDVYSFACTCIPILFGKQPFSGLNDIQVVARIPKEGPWNWDLEDPLQRTLSDCCSVVTKNRPSIRKVLQTVPFVGSSPPLRGTTGVLKSIIAPHDARVLNISNPVATSQLFSGPQVPRRLSPRIRIERELMKEDKRLNLAKTIQPDQLRVPESYPAPPYRGTYNGGPVCIQQINIPIPPLDDLMRGLKRQIRIWRRLTHPNIERLYGWVLSSETESSISFSSISTWAHRDVMGYLRQHPATNRRKMVYHIALGLGYLHSEGVVHADIKLENVRIGGRGNPRLRGFQFSYDHLDKLLPSDYHLSPRFGSPELHNGLTKVPDRGCDVWAFGCVSVQILIGEPPYSNFTDNQIPVAAANSMRPYEWEDLEEFESSIVGCFACPPHRRISIDRVCDTLGSCLAEETKAETSEMSTGGRQGGYVHRSGFSASREKNHPTLKIRTPDAQQLVRPEQTTGSGAFVDVDPELHSERDAKKDVPQVGVSIPRLPSATRYAFIPTVYPQMGRNAIKLDEAWRKLKFELQWEDDTYKDMNGDFVWYSRVFIDGVLSGTGQASKKGIARDQAAYHALLRLMDLHYAIGDQSQQL